VVDGFLNYFNYFTEIERFYQSKRDSFTLLSCLDWVLIENWKEQGVPLECVLKGMDRAFSRPNAKRKINSLAYCAKAVAEVCAEQRDIKPDTPRLPEVSADELSNFKSTLAAAVSRLGSSFPDFAVKFDAVSQALNILDVSNLREAEQRLNALEEKLIALLKVACDETTMLEIKRELDSDLHPFRSTMSTEQLAMLEQQMWRRKLMEHFDVPRLSLFYLL